MSRHSYQKQIYDTFKRFMPPANFPVYPPYHEGDYMEEYFYKYYKQTNGWDQISFRISLWKSNVRIHHMPFEYNVRSAENREKQRKYKHEFGEDHMESRIIHIHYDGEIHRGEYNIDNLDQLQEIVKKKAVDY